MQAVLLALVLSLALCFLVLRRLAEWFQQKGWTLFLPEEERRRPAIGGVLLAGGVLVSAIGGFVTAGIQQSLTGGFSAVCAGLVYALGLGLMGSCDDYLQSVRRYDSGMPRLQRLVPEIGIILAYLAVIGMAGQLSTRMDLPFLGMADWAYGYYPAVFVLLLLLTESVRRLGKRPGVLGAFFSGEAAGLAIGSLWLSQTVSAIVCAGLLGAAVVLWISEVHGFSAPTSGAALFGAGILGAAALGLDFPMVLLFALPVPLVGMLAEYAEQKGIWHLPNLSKRMQSILIFVISLGFGALSAWACSALSY